MFTRGIAPPLKLRGGCEDDDTFPRIDGKEILKILKKKLKKNFTI